MAPILLVFMRAKNKKKKKKKTQAASEYAK
jgi:hypothetical protein